MHTLPRAIVTLFAGLLLAAAARADIIHVDTTATGAGDGSSWEDAFNDLQGALAAAAAGDEIWVAAGVYLPTADSEDRAATFQLLDEVAIVGGFPEGGGELEDRAWQAHVTVLSGDIDGNDVTDDDGVVIDAADIVGANSRHVVTGSGTDETAVLDGFFITAGLTTASTFPDSSGAGLLNDEGGPTLTRIRLSGNRARAGGAMINNINSNPILTDVTFSGNRASNGEGGGMFNVVSSPTLTDVTFSGNTASNSGGGMSNFANSHPTLINVRFNGNGTDSAGGGMNNSGSAPILMNVVFSGNTSQGNGGGMSNSNSSPTLTNVIFRGNTGSSGGGMSNVSGSDAALVNVSFSGNSADQAGGMYSFANSDPTLIHTIFWNNQADGATDTPSASIHNGDSQSIPIIAWSLVDNCNPDGDWVDACGTDGDDNLPDADPVFIDPPDPDDAPTTAGDLRLQPGSPAVDAGDPGTDPGLFPEDEQGDPIDLGGNPRFAGDAIDLGPHELQALELTFDSAELDFGDVEVGFDETLTATLENTGIEDTTGLGFNLAGNAFQVDTSACGTSLPSGGSCPVSVTFAPTETGPAAGTLGVASAEGATADLGLVGNGVNERGFSPIALAVDGEPSELSDGNRVFEPGEAVDVAPAWRNDGSFAQSVGGAATSFTGPDGATYNIDLDGAAYGLVQPGAIATCLDTEVCYRFAVDDPAARPATHWEAVFDEALDDADGTANTWTLHVGESFTDVPPTHIFYGPIETLLHSGVTGGCDDGAYCPNDANSRSQMPVFMLRALMGPEYTPPPCDEGDTPFDDVPSENVFCPWIQDLASRGIVSGCGDGDYCPSTPVSRAQMAIFLLKTLEGSDYTPPTCSSAFDDVPCPSLFADWIEDLAGRGITGGCTAAEYCPNDAVTRAQMAVFITKTFGFTLYGP